MHPRHGHSRKKAGLALVLSGVLSGCPLSPVPPEPPPYDDGPLEKDPACTLTGDLQVTLGEGDGSDFTPLVPGQEPIIHQGPQGGTHASLGVRVDNPATAFPGLKLTFIGEFQDCESTGPCGEPFLLFSRYETVVRDARYFLPQEGGAIAVSGIIMQGPWEGPTRHRIHVTVLDRCGRTGSAMVELGPPAP
jgi:hypothetical protein